MAEQSSPNKSQSESQLPQGEKLKATSLSFERIARFLQVDPDYLDDTDEDLILGMHRASVAYVKETYALDDAYMDAHEDIAIAVLVLTRDMYDHRDMDAYNSASVNRTVSAILACHDGNLL